ncbi:MAG: hydrogenase maturation protease [Ignavibacteria bacterium]|nr:hydrogenase maturation protease [Ignavibacteria bacterium]
MKLEIFIKKVFTSYKKNEITFIGLGNPYRTDDGFGIALSKKLKALFSNVYSESDNLDEVILDLCNNSRRGLVIFLDTADFEGDVGDVKVIPFDEVKDVGKHFHKIPIKLYMKLLMKSKKETYIIAIKPERLDETKEPGLSEIVKGKVDYLFESLKDV